MDESDAKGSSIPWGPLIAVLAAGSSIFLLFQVNSSRPPAPGGKQEYARYGEEDVNARLWQDPLEAVYDELKNHPANDPNFGRLQELRDNILRDRIDPEYGNDPSLSGSGGDSLLILPVFIPGGPYAEEVERRLRDRVAVLQGLELGGFAPEDREHVGYFEIPYPARLEIPPRAGPGEGGEDSAAPPSPWARALPGVSGTAAAGPQLLQIRTDDFSESFVSPPSGGPAKESERRMFVPYEWWTSKAAKGPEIQKKRRTRILLLWIVNEAVYDSPLRRLGDVLSWMQWKTATPGASEGADVAVLGPADSDTLAQMVREVRRPGGLETEARTRLDGTVIYSCMADAADSVLLNGTSVESCDELLTRKVCAGEGEPAPAPVRFQFLRTVLQDDKMVEAMAGELKLRGVREWDDVKAARAAKPGQAPAGSEEDSPDDIAIISEQDTFYAHALQRSFFKGFTGSPFDGESNAGEDIEEDWSRLRLCPWIHVFTYLRGIDGELPSDQEGPSAQAENQGSAKPEAEGASKDTADQEGKQSSEKSGAARTEGLNQADYLQRLAGQIADTDKALELKGRRLKAVGVLGSDVYDKLEIMEALRPKLQGAIFFTNQLDARFALPEEWHVTRNLLVFAPYGLELSGLYQRGIPPFRDSFETSIFEATLEATEVIKDRKADLHDAPRIFEIARSGPFDLSTSGTSNLHPPPDGLNPFWGGKTSGMKFTGAWFPDWTLSRTRWALLAAVLGMLLYLWVWGCTGQCMPVGEQEEREHEQTEEERQWEGWEKRDPLFLRFLRRTPVPVNFILGILADREARQKIEREEPLYSCLIRNPVLVPLAACVVSILWCFYGDRRQQRLEPFSFTDGISIFPSIMLIHLASLLSLWLIAKAHFDLRQNTLEICKKFRLYRIDRRWYDVKWREFFWPGVCPKKSKVVDMAALWETYQERGMFLSRLARVIPMLLLYRAAVWSLISLLGEAPPQIPGRGFTAQVSYPALVAYLLWLLMRCPMVLCFFVIDATRLQAEFVRRCREGASDWLPSTYRKYSYFCTYIGRDDLARYLDIRFIAMRTEAVNTLIYYPFLFMFLVLIAGTNYFDDFAHPLAFTIIDALYLLLALYCAYRLPRIANDYREETIKKLKRSLNSASVDKMRKRKRVLRQVIDKIQNLDEGAFKSLWEQPAIRAILLPSGSFGLLTLAQYLFHS